MILVLIAIQRDRYGPAMRMGWLVIAMACKAKEADPEALPRPPSYDDKQPTFDEKLELVSSGKPPLEVRRTLGRARTLTSVATVGLERSTRPELDKEPGSMKTIVRDFDVELRGTEAAVILDKCEELGSIHNGPCEHDFKGKRWQLELTPRGSIKAYTEVAHAWSVTGHHAAERALIERSIATLFPPLPTEPIGIGATWRVRVSGSTSGGGDATSDTTYELAAITDDALTVTFTTSIKRTTPEWHLDDNGEKLRALNADTGTQRGALFIPIDGASPARTTITEQFQYTFLGDRRSMVGRIEAKPAGKPLPVIPATCAQTAACCAEANLPEEQTSCTKIVAAKQPPACAEHFGVMQRGMFIAGKVIPACLGL